MTKKAFALYALYFATRALAECRAPLYQNGFVLADTDLEFTAGISIPLQGFAPASLVCLATKLKERFRGRSSIVVNIFSSREAARWRFPVIEGPGDAWKAFDQMHAQYVFDASKHKEYLVLKPEGDTPRISGRLSDTTVDLPAAGIIPCRPKINGRCVIAFESVEYPEVSGARPSGSVTLTGVMARNGKIGDIRVLNTEPGHGVGTDVLAKAAIDNLSSWQLEAGPRKEQLQITFSSRIDESLHYRGDTRVEWVSPNEVRVWGGDK